MDQRGFLELHLLCVLSTLAKVRVLINGTRDQARDRLDFFLVRAEDVREAGGKRGGGLCCAEEVFTDIVAVVEAEGAPHGVDGDPLGHATDVLVEGAADKIQVAENEGLFRVEPDGNDVLDVCSGELARILHVDLLRMHQLFVVTHHDHQRDIEDIL